MINLEENDGQDYYKTNNIGGREQEIIFVRRTIMRLTTRGQMTNRLTTRRLIARRMTTRD